MEQGLLEGKGASVRSIGSGPATKQKLLQGSWPNVAAERCQEDAKGIANGVGTGGVTGGGHSGEESSVPVA